MSCYSAASFTVIRYSADHNHEIETAFRNGARALSLKSFRSCTWLFDSKALQADIVIGIRSYEVLFEGSTMHGKQAALQLPAFECQDCKCGPCMMFANLSDLMPILFVCIHMYIYIYTVSMYIYIYMYPCIYIFRKEQGVD